jgi:hypothetical protein
MIQRKVASLLRKISNRLDPLPPKPAQVFKSSLLTFDDLDADFKEYYDLVIDFTKTSTERLYALHTAINYIVSSCISGSVVECGVWRGGSSMLSALRLKALGDATRMLYLYDTYAGMSEPKKVDVNIGDNSAINKWNSHSAVDKNLWDYVPLEEVQQNMRLTEYPEDYIRFVKGKVEDTMPSILPDRIALLRLDTDWYESTYHEMVHLYPLLEIGGVLLIDDYGHWKGARKAVDQYITENRLSLYLHRIDYTGRVAIKLN